MDLRTAMDLVVTHPDMDYRSALRDTKTELTWDHIKSAVEDPELRAAYREVLATEWAGISGHLPADPRSTSVDPNTTTRLPGDPTLGSEAQLPPGREAQAQSRQRDNEDRVLAAAADLDPDDHSGVAEQLRETAGSIADNHEMEARRERWRREDDTPAPRPAVSAESAARTRASVARTDDALRACDAALAELDDADTAEFERTEEVNRWSAQDRADAAEQDTSPDRELFWP